MYEYTVVLYRYVIRFQKQDRVELVAGCHWECYSAFWSRLVQELALAGGAGCHQPDLKRYLLFTSKIHLITQTTHQRVQRSLLSNFVSYVQYIIYMRCCLEKSLVPVP